MRRDATARVKSTSPGTWMWKWLAPIWTLFLESKEPSCLCSPLHKSKIGIRAAQVSSNLNLERKKVGALEERWCWLSQEQDTGGQGLFEFGDIDL